MGLTGIVKEALAEVNPLNDYRRLSLDKAIRGDQDLTTAEIICFFPRFWFKPIIRGSLIAAAFVAGANYLTDLSYGQQQADIMQYMSEARKYALLGSIADMSHLMYQAIINRNHSPNTEPQ